MFQLVWNESVLKVYSMAYVSLLLVNQIVEDSVLMSPGLYVPIDLECSVLGQILHVFGD